MSKAIQVVISNSNDMTAPVPNSEQTPSLLASVKAAYPHITDLERYALFKHLEEWPHGNAGEKNDCSAVFKRTQISQAAEGYSKSTQRYLEYLEAKNSIEKSKAAEPFMPSVTASARGRNLG